MGFPGSDKQKQSLPDNSRRLFLRSFHRIQNESGNERNEPPEKGNVRKQKAVQFGGVMGTKGGLERKCRVGLGRETVLVFCLFRELGWLISGGG